MSRETGERGKGKGERERNIRLDNHSSVARDKDKPGEGAGGRERGGRRGASAGRLYLISAVLFGLFLLLGLAVGRGIFFSFDLALSRSFASWRPPWFVMLIDVVSWFGYIRGGGLVAFTVVVALSALRRRREDLFLLLTLIIIVLADVFKDVFNRPRPTAALIGFDPVSASGASYPSGHAAFSAAVYGFILALVLILMVNRFWKMVLAILVIAVISGVAFSRVYLGAHFATDVAGGLLIGTTWALMLTAAYLREPEQ